MLHVDVDHKSLTVPTKAVGNYMYKNYIFIILKAKIDDTNVKFAGVVS